MSRPSFADHSSTTSEGGSASTAASTSPVSRRRPRKQVSRACDWCRARRIRCDNGQPCKACLRRDARCTREGVGPDEPRTLPQALKELERARARVKELEESRSRVHDAQPVSLPQGSSSPKTPTHSWTSSRSTRPQWEGIHVATSRSSRPSYYGPVSVLYFVNRIGEYLGRTLHQPFAERSLQPRGAGRAVHLVSSPTREEREVEEPAVPRSDRQSGQLSRAQEESYLRLFWEGYNCTVPIVDETEFREHYASLWEESSRKRKQCPIVDVVLALCLQYGYAFVSRGARDSSSSAGDGSIAGRWYYRRAQALLATDLESPGLATVQCYCFMAVYLCCASLQNMCHTIIGQGVRTAQILGLHLEPSPKLPQGQRELRKRIWWMLWSMDAKVSAKHGRPFLIDWAQVTVTPPADDIKTASLNGAMLGSYGPDVTWLSYSLHQRRLVLPMVEIHDALFVAFGEAIHQKELSCLYDDPDALESCAKLLATRLPDLTRDWVNAVPEGLKIPRRRGGEPLSTDRSPADFDALVPTWLQGQRLCLELMYHNLVINLTRPFITFPSPQEQIIQHSYTPLTSRLATTCIDHAIAYTLLMHQAVMETDYMNGWTEYFSLQWNASVTLVGFALANPVHPAASRVRDALDKAVETFDVYGKNFAVSADAAAITRDLMGKADLLAARMTGETLADDDVAVGPQLGREASVPVLRSGGDPAQTSSEFPAGDDGMAWMTDPAELNQLMDWAMSVDSFNNYGDFLNVGGSADPWVSGP